MNWYIICPVRGLIHSVPDDDKGEIKVIQYCRELANDIKREGYSLKDIVAIRGESKQVLPPGDWQLVDKKWS